jgi:hypothetical protein
MKRGSMTADKSQPWGQVFNFPKLVSASYKLTATLDDFFE